MKQHWQIVIYKSPSGNYPVKDFIGNLELKGHSKVNDSIKLLREFGTSLGPPHVKKLAGTALWELRILGGDSLRIIYIAFQVKTFLLLHGFKKKTTKTPS